MIFQLQLSLLQPTQLQFLMTRSLNQKINHGVQITMLDFQFDNAALYFFSVGAGHIDKNRKIVTGRR